MRTLKNKVEHIYFIAIHVRYKEINTREKKSTANGGKVCVFCRLQFSQQKQRKLISYIFECVNTTLI